jgi:hypothetical protein
MARIVKAPLLFAAVFGAVLLAHLPLLHLPYYWDEAGYYIPAAYDFFRTGSLIPFSTLSNAHPPLPPVYLALWWKVFGFAPWVTRTAVCAVASLALLGVYRIAVVSARRRQIAVAATMLTAIYPIWFAQSSLAHADIFAAAGTLWALAFFLEDRTWASVLCFSIAALSKETAIVTPLALVAWGICQRLASRSPVLLQSKKTGHPAPSTQTNVETSIPGAYTLRMTMFSSVRHLGAFLLPVLPLACWYAWHWHRTGSIFGNPEYLRYNATATMTPLRILLAFAHRCLQITGHMNLFVPVLISLACMMLPPVEESVPSTAESMPLPGPLQNPCEQRGHISDRIQGVFYVVIFANLALFSVFGGALLTRYLLPLYPLVLLLCVNTFYRRVRRWPALVALSAAGFVAGIFVNPPYRFAPEDNLAYRDVVLLHQAAIRQIEQHYPGATMLTAWPVTDELHKPELGYVSQPIQTVAIDNFSFNQMDVAVQLGTQYSVALVFSTKYDPPHLWLDLGRKNEAFELRYFDFHRDLPPEEIARLLGGKIVWRGERQGLWAAVLHFDRAEEARAKLRSNERAFGTAGALTAF